MLSVHFKHIKNSLVTNYNYIYTRWTRVKRQLGMRSIITSSITPKSIRG